VAAHITAAARGGPRYDETLTDDQRRSAENGIWTCQNCGAHVDRDQARFTVDELLGMKKAAEDAAAKALGQPPRAEGEAPGRLIGAPDLSQFESELAGAIDIPGLDRIASRGYWRVVIRPGGYRSSRIPNVLDLRKQLRRLSVHSPGLFFPRVPARESAPAGADFDQWSGGREPYLEAWRFYQSGQLVHNASIPEDWQEPDGLRPIEGGWAPGKILRVTHTIHRLMEVCELAARIASSDGVGDYLEVSVWIMGLRGRIPWLDDDGGHFFGESNRARIQEFGKRWFMPRPSFMSDPKALARDAASELFRYFGWDPLLEELRGWQNQEPFPSR
jgi:ribosomal protein L37AE/L43A